MIRVFIYTCCFFLLYGCWDIQQGDPLFVVASGKWKGDFSLKEQSVPVLFEVDANQEAIRVKFNNGANFVEPDSIRQLGDTLYLHFGQGEKLLKLVGDVDRIDGFLIDNTQDEYPIPFSAQCGNFQRFPNIRKTPAMNLTGEWALSININQDSTEQASIQFVANNNYLQATLHQNNRSTTLEGTVQDDRIYLSGFDGTTVYFFNARIGTEGKLNKGRLLLNNISYFCDAELKAGVSSN